MCPSFPSALILSGLSHPAWNMAVDEALLRCAQERGEPQILLRVYGWDRPSASLGYFLKFAAVRATFPQDEQIPFLVRRPTGGGAVRHANDWTYSLVFSQDWLPADARDDASSYRYVHALLRDALLSIPGLEGLDALPQVQAQRGKITDCFSQPSAYDLMLDRKKIAGGAQRRSKGWILHQGSVQMQESNPSVILSEAKDLAVRFFDCLRQSQNDRATVILSEAKPRHLPESRKHSEDLARDLTADEQQLASELFTTRYNTDDWNQKF